VLHKVLKVPKKPKNSKVFVEMFFHMLHKGVDVLWILLKVHLDHGMLLNKKFKKISHFVQVVKCKKNFSKVSSRKGDSV